MSTKAEELRQQARKSELDAIESFERCDTDGALSQWASQVNARRLYLEADLAEKDYVWTFSTLGDKEGNLVPNKLIETKYGYAYAIFNSFEDLESFESPILQWVGLGDKAIAKKGYTSIVVKAKGKVAVGKGWSPNVYVDPVAPFFTPDNCQIVKQSDRLSAERTSW